MKENLKEFGTTFVAKLDLKSIIIIILFIIAGVFYTQAMLSGNEHKEQIKKLEKENKVIEKEKKEVQKDFNKLLKKFEEDSIKLNKLQMEFSELEEDLEKVNNRLESKIKEASKYQKQLKELQNKINDFEQNPPNREGKELLNSIQEKTKK